MRPAIVLMLALCLSLTGCASPNQGENEGSARLQFHSFDGGGPQYRVMLGNEAIVSVAQTRQYAKKNHQELDGAGYDVIFTFTGKQPGTTAMTVEERSPIAGNFDHLYEVTVDEGLQVSLRQLSTVDLDQATEPTATLVLETDSGVFYAALADNAAAAAFRDRLNAGPITVQMQDYGHFEKVGQLPWPLESSDEEITTAPGDILLYQGDRITVYYDENTWRFTPLAKIEGATRESLLDGLGPGDATITFYLEWSE